MANKQLLERIKRLENRKSTAYKPAPPVPLSWYVVGYFSPTYSDEASPCENYYRALSCEHARAFDSLTDEQRAERHDAAWARIMRKRRIDSDAKLMALLRKLDRAKVVPDEAWAALDAIVPVSSSRWPVPGKSC